VKNYNIAIAGSTNYTASCFKALSNDPRFNISWILTPPPKPVGRKKTITSTPLDIEAKKHNTKTFFVDKKIDQKLKEKINSYSANNQIDFLLVVDFGYFIPTWLLNLPTLAPINIHPSKLPSWRGSSPAQFNILFNNKESAVTMIIMNNKLDQGSIISQQNFKVKNDWTQKEYYDHAFNLVTKNLGNTILIYQQAEQQPLESPTFTARTLNKNDSFIEWKVLKEIISNKTSKAVQLSSALLTKALEHNQSLAITLERASKAFNPWPSLWTIVPTKKGDRRMKLINLEIINDKLVIDVVQLEGKQTTKYNEIKNIILASSSE